MINGIPDKDWKSYAKFQFEFWTYTLGLEHTFAFEEIYEIALEKRKEKMQLTQSKEEFRSSIMKVQENMEKRPDALIGKETEKRNPLKHSFADGCYIREVFNPKGELLVTKIHKVKHPFFLMKGEMSVLTEDGIKRFKAPHQGITPAGTKRIIYCHEDCVFITVHATEETDINKIEEQVIAKDFEAFDSSEIEAFKKEVEESL
tara:strand:- start:1302 stop:1910 length:609 start_codon:yes stop_codon:yes gene_type:complete